MSLNPHPTYPKQWTSAMMSGDGRNYYKKFSKPKTIKNNETVNYFAKKFLHFCNKMWI